MRIGTVVVVAVALVGARPAVSRACLWDSDTLAEESIEMPEVADIVSGKIASHSKAFYQAKATYTRKVIDGGKAPRERWDDLAVALARIGQVDEAIAVMADKEQRFPGEYTTEANLGTFLAMKGDLKGAITHLEAAIRINPDAHFGREKYQVTMLRQALEARAARRRQPKIKRGAAPSCANLFGLPEAGEEARDVERPGKSMRGDRAVPEVPADAVVAMAGLIRFGTAENSPDVWFNLGVALAFQGHKNLASRALRRAEKLGHGCAARFGEPVVRVSPRLHDWYEAADQADDAWSKGAAVAAAVRKLEDDLVARKLYKIAFGY